MQIGLIFSSYTNALLMEEELLRVYEFWMLPALVAQWLTHSAAMCSRA